MPFLEDSVSFANEDFYNALIPIDFGFGNRRLYEGTTFIFNELRDITCRVSMCDNRWVVFTLPKGVDGRQYVVNWELLIGKVTVL